MLFSMPDNGYVYSFVYLCGLRNTIICSFQYRVDT